MVGVPTPRVNASTIRNYTNSIVRVVGIAQNDSVLQAFDGPINIRKQQGNVFISGNVFEVVGTVNSDGSVTENFVYDWGNSAVFDMEVYNNMLKVYQKYSNEIFV